MNDLLDVMRTLRAPNGCPWDQQQTHQSLRPYLLEEACEAVDALSASDDDAICEELGDVLLQVAFHAVIAEERHSFSYRDIEAGIVDKLIRRHPHVFADLDVSGADEVLQNWEAIKASEKTTPLSLAERVPRSLPALMRAEALGKALSWPTAPLPDLAEDDTPQETVGLLLLAAVDYARAQGVNAELALREALDARAAAETGVSP